jgi:FGGY-family pentulose kinase
LSDLADEGFRRIGTRIRPMGEPVGRGLTPSAAQELGLHAGTPVGVSIIDAHAGGLGVLGAILDPRAEQPPGLADFDTRLALIGGTSSCHMVVSRETRFVPGVWGPYYSAMIPGMWLNEGGQSATGALIDHIIFAHARSAELQQQAKSSARTVYELLNDRLAALAGGRRYPATLTRELHVLPYFHGDRSPRADASLRGMISGLTLDDSVDSLALLYVATVQSIAHGTRHIIDTLNVHGYRIDTIFACGGGTKNPVFLREHADISGCRIVLPREPEAVLLGSAVLGAVASADYPGVIEAMTAMNAAGQIIEPTGGALRAFHDAKHRVFLRMYDDQMAYRACLAPSGEA